MSSEIKDYKTQQLLLIISSVLTVVSAGIWSEIAESVFEKYFHDSIKYKLFYGIIITAITVYFIDWLVNKKKLVNKEEHEKMQQYSLQNMRLFGKK